MDTLVSRVCLVLYLVVAVHPSAIPMWEFLSRGEKMNHLFNMFAKQVSHHCDTSTMPDCNKVLMVHGLSNLAKMQDENLDEMDPYQRGAMDIIWDHMMHGHDDQKHTEPNSPNFSTDPYDNEPVPGDNHLGAESRPVEQFFGSGSPQYVMGPMVVRVFPDGRPVPGDSAKPMPKDEDAEEHQAMRVKPVPSMLDLLHGRDHHDQSTTAESQ